MTLLATIAAIVAFIAIPLALGLFIYLAPRLAKLARKSRYDCETDDAELTGFFIVPEAINSINERN